jgi:hypothetical protein
VEEIAKGRADFATCKRIVVAVYSLADEVSGTGAGLVAKKPPHCKSVEIVIWQVFDLLGGRPKMVG